ncbi:MAG: IclR family transcriptional regulator [Terricaulis sp.]|nr:IclR family transcriptional regulator [Terricaulis sp.]
MRKPLDEALNQKRRVQSIEVGFRVIRVLQAAREPMALRDIAKAAAMPPSKAHLYLTSFLREGLVAQEAETGRYALGAYAMELGLSAIRQISVVDMARAEMTSLTARTGCATYLSLFTERGPAIVSKADGSRQGAFSVRLGHVLPMASSATGLVFLAFLPETHTKMALNADALASGAEAKKVTQRQIAAIKSSGYATTSGLINANFAAISAPVFDYSGDLAAALTLLGPDKYLAGARLEQCTQDLLQAARKISAKLGGAPG